MTTNRWLTRFGRTSLGKTMTDGEDAHLGDLQAATATDTGVLVIQGTNGAVSVDIPDQGRKNALKDVVEAVDVQGEQADV